MESNITRAPVHTEIFYTKMIWLDYIHNKSWFKTLVLETQVGLVRA